MALDLHFYANPYDKSLHLPIHIFLEKAIDRMYLESIWFVLFPH